MIDDGSDKWYWPLVTHCPFGPDQCCWRYSIVIHSHWWLIYCCWCYGSLLCYCYWFWPILLLTIQYYWWRDWYSLSAGDRCYWNWCPVFKHWWPVLTDVRPAYWLLVMTIVDQYCYCYYCWCYWSDLKKYSVADWPKYYCVEIPVFVDLLLMLLMILLIIVVVDSDCWSRAVFNLSFQVFDVDYLTHWPGILISIDRYCWCWFIDDVIRSSTLHCWRFGIPDDDVVRYIWPRHSVFSRPGGPDGHSVDHSAHCCDTIPPVLMTIVDDDRYHSVTLVVVPFIHWKFHSVALMIDIHSPNSVVFDYLLFDVYSVFRWPSYSVGDIGIVIDSMGGLFGDRYSQWYWPIDDYCYWYCWRVNCWLLLLMFIDDWWSRFSDKRYSVTQAGPIPGPVPTPRPRAWPFDVLGGSGPFDSSIIVEALKPIQSVDIHWWHSPRATPFDRLPGDADPGLTIRWLPVWLRWHSVILLTGSEICWSWWLRLVFDPIGDWPGR